MKLFVDDIRQAPDDTWQVARTATAAIRAIARYEFDVISLDHDISHQVQVGTLSRPYPCEETFAAVAYFIAEKYRHDVPVVDYRPNSTTIATISRLVPKVILHTSNQVAGDEMARVLAGVGILTEKKYMGAANRLEMEV